MNSRTADRLAVLLEDIEEARTRLAILQEALDARRSVAGDFLLRALAAETPLADRHYQEADQACREIEAQIEERERALLGLEVDRARLAGGSPVA